jgi:hypothetical protein
MGFIGEPGFFLGEEERGRSHSLLPFRYESVISIIRHGKLTISPLFATWCLGNPDLSFLPFSDGELDRKQRRHPNSTHEHSKHAEG